MIQVSPLQSQNVHRLRSRAIDAPAASGARVLGADELLLGRASAGNAVTLHVSAGETLEALLKSIREAKSSFYIETFIWKDDEAGREIAHALVERKREADALGEPFDAKVLIDSVGMREQLDDGFFHKLAGGSFKNIRKILEDGGVEVQVFNSKIVSLQGGGVPITHRKLYIADGERFMTGGRNIGDEYLKPTFGPDGENAWHDLAYTVEGTEAATITRRFFENWVKAGGKAPESLPTPVPAAGGSAKIRTIVTDPSKDLYEIQQVHSKAIASARREIVVMTPYLTDDRQVEDLIKAKKKNPDLDIRVMLPAAKEGGFLNLFALLHMETAKQLLDAGIEVRLYEGEMVSGELVPRYMHLKAMMIDGKMLSLGSANGDTRTFKKNYELNTLIEDPETVAEFQRRVVDPDWASSRPLTQKDVKLPFFKRILARVLEWLDFLV